ncbi:DUF4254 domain-containing protein [Faecalibacter bovis]|uniref:DUF4254 domain-containing protein n=1 Tax=Faecalibacter bovis TaxID=2898187 RepID=A0ABX7XFD0_9FLAO|nr:DUF4254 domain-containing protein [Faecalibacter bovis]MBS7334160.1 DUF4254 domain-containing protein [Weeksellaceae bacterium]QTV06599.1 DUF4254 domain-containing protein [Faecalibacter bovis]
MKFTERAWEIFNESINDYHQYDDVNRTIENPYDESNLIEHLLYKKNWIDTVQWHLEDIIRDPQIDPVEALSLKRWIDKSNQERTDMVEYVDSWFLQQYANVEVKADAKINTESPAWAVDRFSILSLKVYHMQQEVDRTDATPEHIAACQAKLDVLKQQHIDLSTAIEELLVDFQEGNKYMRVYKQMKMYNDESLNPVLYANKK